MPDLLTEKNTHFKNCFPQKTINTFTSTPPLPPKKNVYFFFLGGGGKLFGSTFFQLIFVGGLFSEALKNYRKRVYITF